MESTAHFYNPKDDSLDERIHAYKEAFRASQNVEASFRFYDQQGWEDRLGSKEDLQKAMEITQHTLDMAIDSFSIEEIHNLSKQNLVTQEEFELLNERQSNQDVKNSIIEARKREMANNREKNSNHQNLEKDL